MRYDAAKICKVRCGFTLIEAMIAMVLLGFAITALLLTNGSLTNTNGAGLEASNAEFLVEQIREQTAAMTFANLAAAGLNGKTYSPPKDSQGNSLTAFSGYSQKITAQYVNASDLHTVSGSATPFYRVTVDIYLNGNEKLSSASWLRANY